MSDRAGRFCLAERLGDGRRGAVWRAVHDSGIDFEVAVKRSPSELGLAYARGLARLDHPASVRLLDVVPTDGGSDEGVSVVLELARGRALADSELGPLARLGTLKTALSLLAHAAERAVAFGAIDAPDLRWSERGLQVLGVGRGAATAAHDLQTLGRAFRAAAGAGDDPDAMIRAGLPADLAIFVDALAGGAYDDAGTALADLTQGRPTPRRPARPPAPLLGRAAVVAELTAALGPGGVCAVVGPPGIGKTRVLQAAAPDPVVWCDLGSVRTAEQLAGALDRAAAGDPDAIADRAVTIVLDSAEVALGPVADQLARWLARPGLRAAIAVGTRRTTGLSVGRVVAVGPLAERDAAALFLDRARRRVPGYASGPADVATVGAIVERLDRVPLLVELAAGRAHRLAPAELLARLGSALDLLAESRATTDRADTVRALLGWSWDLLTAPQQRDLCRLAAFRGPFSADLAASLVDGEALHLLADLAGSGWLEIRDDPATGDRWYTAWRVTRQFALERMDGRDGPPLAVRHASAVSRRARAELADLRGHRGVRAAAALRLLREDLRAVVERETDPDARGWAALALHDSVVLEGRPGGDWLDRIAALPLSDDLRAEVARRTTRALPDDADTLEAAAARGDAWAEARAALALGSSLLDAGAADDGERLCADAIDRADALGALLDAGRARVVHARTLRAVGRPDDAGRELAEAWALAEELGHMGLRAEVAGERARAALAAGDRSEARRWAAAAAPAVAAAVRSELDGADPADAIGAGWSALHRGDPVEAAALAASLDPVGFVDRERAERLRRALPAARLVVGPEDAWFEVGSSGKVSLVNRPVARRLFAALVSARRERPGEVLSTEALVGAAWASERIRWDSATNRLYVALSSLRQLGLRDVLQRAGDGWRLDPAIPVEP